jgi:hypothetical protein
MAPLLSFDAFYQADFVTSKSKASAPFTIYNRTGMDIRFSFRRGSGNLIQQTVIEEGKSLNICELDFIKPVNCNLTLRISDQDLGITSPDNLSFYCDLTIIAYKDMVTLMKPFCVVDDSGGYQWLYDVDTPIDFLISPGGGW